MLKSLSVFEVGKGEGVSRVETDGKVYSILISQLHIYFLPWLCFALRRAHLCWRLARTIRHVDRGGRHACALEPQPVDRATFAHYASRMLTTVRLHPTRLETRTKESNMCASLRVIETRGRNESKGHPRWLR